MDTNDYIKNLGNVICDFECPLRKYLFQRNVLMVSRRKLQPETRIREANDALVFILDEALPG